MMTKPVLANLVSEGVSTQPASRGDWDASRNAPPTRAPEATAAGLNPPAGRSEAYTAPLRRSLFRQ